MVILKNCEFLSHENSPIVSKVFPNVGGDVLALNIQGADGVFHLEGRAGRTAEWISLAGINLSDFSAVSGGFKKAGLYELGIVSVREMRVRIESASGDVSITGQIISSQEG